jgi:putative flippase GtrA
MASETLVGSARTHLKRRPVRYAMVSAVAVPFTQVVLVLCHALLHFSPVWSNVTAVTLACVPSYFLNRMWVWGKRGRSHLWKEVLPFWAMALLGLAVSTLLVALAARWTDATIVVMLANLTAFGALWVIKYLVLDSLLFRIPDDVDPSLV